MHWKELGALAILTLLAAGCTANGTTGQVVVTPEPAVTVAPIASPTAAAKAGARITGTVQSIAGDRVTLTGGQSFALASATQITRMEVITANDLQKGQYVAITAKRQPDNTLLASIVNI